MTLSTLEKIASTGLGVSGTRPAIPSWDEVYQSFKASSLDLLPKRAVLCQFYRRLPGEICLQLKPALKNSNFLPAIMSKSNFI